MANAQLCEQALDLFVSIYGAEAGNLALKLMATGGVYLGGGIAPKMLAKLSGPLFMQAFTGKGRMQALLESMPVMVITNDQIALLGAARCAQLKAPRKKFGMASSPEIRVSKTSQELFDAAAKEFAAQASEAVRDQGQVHSRALWRLNPETALFPAGGHAFHSVGQDLFFLGRRAPRSSRSRRQQLPHGERSAAVEG